MQCRYPLYLSSSKPWSVSSNYAQKNKHKPKTLQQTVRLFKSEFIGGFFVPLFPVFVRHLDVFVLLGEWGTGAATEVSASCLFIQCNSKAGVGIFQLSQEAVNK